jgi:hypothetical protein
MLFVHVGQTVTFDPNTTWYSNNNTIEVTYASPVGTGVVSGHRGFFLLYTAVDPSLVPVIPVSSTPSSSQTTSTAVYTVRETSYVWYREVVQLPTT